MVNYKAILANVRCGQHASVILTSLETIYYPWVYNIFKGRTDKNKSLIIFVVEIIPLYYAQYFMPAMYGHAPIVFGSNRIAHIADIKLLDLVRYW